MISLAVVDPVLAAAVAAEGPKLGFELVWSGPDPRALLTTAVAPDVVVVDLGHLGGEAQSFIRALRQRGSTKTLITTYTFARRDEVDALRDAGSDVVLQGPLSVRSLRTFLLSLLIDDRMNRRMPTPPPGPNAETAPVVEPRYSRRVLMALRDLPSALQCECPNHVAELVDRLLAFEAYSKECEDRDDDDARVHRALWFATARARRIMEDALDELVRHERIDIRGDTVSRARS